MNASQQAATRPRSLSSLPRALAVLAAGFLAACSNQATSTSVATNPAATPAAPSGETIGSGPTKIALLVPISGPASGQAMRNAAELAYKDAANPDVQILVKDTAGTAQGGQAAAAQAVQEGAQLIIGPVFAQEVSAAAGVARQAGVPMIAFSTDPNVAARGVFLLSFLAETEVDRVVGHAVSAGRRSFAALIPETTYGSIAEAAFQEAVSRHGGRVAGIERLSGDPARDREAAARIAQLATEGSTQVDAVFIPEGGQGLRSSLDALQAAGLNTSRVKLIGTGVWNDAQSLADPRLQGGWFAGPSPEGFSLFSNRYRQAYGQPPFRVASLAYDATLLGTALAKAGGYSEEVLLNPNGFAGIADGIFRFKANGLNERGLAVLEVKGGSVTVVSPAQQTFQNSRVASQ